LDKNILIPYTRNKPIENIFRIENIETIAKEITGE
jgi:hypothetical protein